MRPSPALPPDSIPDTLRDGEAPRASGVVPRLSGAERPGESEPQRELGIGDRASALVEGSPAMLEALARVAAEHLAAGERVEAATTASDALRLLARAKERAPLEGALLLVGECLVGLDSPQRALAPLEECVALADARADLAAGARARCALGRARLALGDAACRELFEDAGELLEELADRRRRGSVAGGHADDDAEALAAVEALLRLAEARIDESPRSFHARTISSTPPPPVVRR
jgi:hypothetical protein